MVTQLDASLSLLKAKIKKYEEIEGSSENSLMEIRVEM